jgi:hypothetical protein
MNAYKLLVGEAEGKRPQRRPRCRWVDSIKAELVEIALVDMDWIGLAENRGKWRAVVNAVMNLHVL